MPSLINELLLGEVSAVTGKASQIILIDPSKLKSGETLKLRSDLRKAGAKLKVSKVRIIRRAVPAQAAKLLEKSKGSVGVILATDMVAAAKIVSDLAKEEKLAVRGGLMDGTTLDVAGIKKISELPSKQQLYGMLVNVLAAPIVGFARVIAEIEKKQNPAPAAEAAPAEAAPAV